jgi:hypothetical protein
MKKSQGEVKPKEPNFWAYMSVIILVFAFSALSAWLLAEKPTVAIPPLCSLMAGSVAFAIAWNGTKLNPLLRLLWFFGILYFGLGIIAQIVLLFVPTA